MNRTKDFAVFLRHNDGNITLLCLAEHPGEGEILAKRAAVDIQPGDNVRRIEIHLWIARKNGLGSWVFLGTAVEMPKNHGNSLE